MVLTLPKWSIITSLWNRSTRRITKKCPINIFLVVFNWCKSWKLNRQNLDSKKCLICGKKFVKSQVLLVKSMWCMLNWLTSVISKPMNYLTSLPSKTLTVLEWMGLNWNNYLTTGKVILKVRSSLLILSRHCNRSYNKQKHCLILQEKKSCPYQGFMCILTDHFWCATTQISGQMQNKQ